MKVLHRNSNVEYNVLGFVNSAIDALPSTLIIIYERNGLKYAKELGEFCNKFVSLEGKTIPPHVLETLIKAL